MNAPIETAANSNSTPREAALLVLKSQVSAFEVAFADNGNRLTMHDVISLMHSQCAAISLAQRAGCLDTDIRRLIAPARRVHAKSAFVNRLQCWPRGYPGDFETIEWLADGRPRCQVDDPIYWLEWYALNCAIAQQHRNKLAWQHKLMARVAAEGGRILSIGCGGCADVAIDPRAVAGAEFVLLDSDADALRLATDRLRGARNVQAIQKDAIRGIKDLIRLGPYDLVICGGLFDYLSDQAIIRLLRTVYQRALTQAGMVAFTNIGHTNEFRVWIEHLASWHLAHRTPAGIRHIASQAQVPDHGLRVETDATGIALLCLIARAEGDCLDE